MAALRQAPIPGPGLGMNAHASRNFPEAATQTFKTGAMMVVSSGYAQEAGTNPTVIAGIAMQPGSNLTAAGTAEGAYDGFTRIFPSEPHNQVEMNLDKASTLGAYTSLVTDLNTAYGLTRDTNGIWYVDVDKTGANSRVVVMGFRDPIGTVSARVYVAFRPSVTLTA